MYVERKVVLYRDINVKCDMNFRTFFPAQASCNVKNQHQG